VGIFAGIGCCGCTFLLFGIMLLVFWLEPDTSEEDMNDMFVNVSGWRGVFPSFKSLSLGALAATIPSQRFFNKTTTTASQQIKYITMYAISLGTSIFPLGLMNYHFKRCFEKEGSYDAAELPSSASSAV
jgi:hypothetical protein